MIKVFMFMEFALVISLVMIIVTQVIIPALEKRLLFPFFRKQHVLENTLIELNQRKVEKGLQSEINNERKQDGE